MNRKLNTGSLKTEPPVLTNDHPTILGGARTEKFRLPADFDLTYHKKILASGKVKATTKAEFAAMIAELEKQLKSERHSQLRRFERLTLFVEPARHGPISPS